MFSIIINRCCSRHGRRYFLVIVHRNYFSSVFQWPWHSSYNNQYHYCDNRIAYWDKRYPNVLKLRSYARQRVFIISIHSSNGGGLGSISFSENPKKPFQQRAFAFVLISVVIKYLRPIMDQYMVQYTSIYGSS